MDRLWESTENDSNYIEAEGDFNVIIDDVKVLPESGTPQVVKVRFKDPETGKAIFNDYRFFKKDGSVNFGARKAFERLLELHYGPDFSSWNEEDLMGKLVCITVTSSESGDRTFYNVSRVSQVTDIEDDGF